ncbi:unnamed protein product [Protopolystoma xenopodis]|uniref:F-BAR domain-containing protein n=1 Tax=Protopolystoma xenopodis TaxID=117903 RepID=A0A448X6K5_9PLAT|nr:unnamed protein product [Protopolystoma xenopodis]
MENFHLFASTCESLARELTNGGNETMKRQIKRNKEVAKQCETVPKLQNTLNQDRRMLVNLWRNYFAAYRAKVKAEEVCNKAKQDLSPACNEVVKYDTIAKNKSTTFRHMKKVYAQELKQFTTQQRQYFTHGLKEVLCEFELNDWAQVSAIRQLLQCTSDADSECLDKMKSLTEAARILIDEINPGRDSSHVVESFSSQSLHPLDLPFLDLDKCPSALLEGNSSSLACYLLAKNANLSSIKTSRVSETLEVGVGNNVVIGGVCKDDKSLLKSAFICGIGIRPLHINEMSSSQLSDRINVLIKLQQQLEAELSLRGNLQNCLQTNSKSRQKDGLDPKVGCLIRAIFSINNQITRLVQRFNEISKQHKFTDWSSNENADRLNQDAIDSVEDSPYIWSDSAFSPSSQESFGTS